MCFGSVCITWRTVRDGAAIANKGQAGSPPVREHTRSDDDEDDDDDDDDDVVDDDDDDDDDDD